MKGTAVREQSLVACGSVRQMPEAATKAQPDGSGRGPELESASSRGSLVRGGAEDGEVAFDDVGDAVLDAFHGEGVTDGDLQEVGDG